MRTRTLLAALALLPVLVACKMPGSDSSKAAASASASAASAAPVASASAKPQPKYTGSYVQTQLKSSSSQTQQVEKNEVSTLVLDDAQAVWTQSYSGKNIVETYTYAPSDVTKSDDAISIALTFKGIEKGGANYNPDSGNPKVELAKSDTGWDLTLSYKDTAGSMSKHTFKQVAAAK